MGTRANQSSQAYFLRLLANAPFERSRYGWRFGTRRIGNQVVAKLVAAGRARIDGDRVHLAEIESRS